MVYDKPFVIRAFYFCQNRFLRGCLSGSTLDDALRKRNNKKQIWVYRGIPMLPSGQSIAKKITLAFLGKPLYNAIC